MDQQGLKVPKGLKEPQEELEELDPQVLKVLKELKVPQDTQVDSDLLET